MSRDKVVTPGRVVHYWMEPYPGAGLKPHAAIVTTVHNPENVNLCVFDISGQATVSRPGVHHGTPFTKDVWCWIDETLSVG